jgi:hypothetical protein
MSGDPSVENANSNGEYWFDPNTVRAGVAVTAIGLLLFGALGILGGYTGGLHFQRPIMSLILCLALIGALRYIARLSGRNLRISEDGIVIRDKKGNEIGSLHWVGLARVTETRRMAQLALWDRSGVRRTMVDQQFENFPAIRSRILTEYAKVFELFEDRIVLRSLFKTEKIYRKSVSTVEWEDIANPRSGTKFSLVILKTTDGKPRRITSKFGSIPEIYLTLGAWLAQPSR